MDELVSNPTVEAIDIDFYDVRVEVAQLPAWGLVWMLGPKHNVREADTMDSKLVVASEPSLILVASDYKEALLAGLTRVACLVAPASSPYCLAERPVHICVPKLMDVLRSVGIEHVRVLGYGQKQPRRPFLDILPLAPHLSRTNMQVGPGLSVDIFAADNSYDVSFTIQTPGMIHILDAAALGYRKFVDAPDLIPQQRSESGSLLHAVKYLKLTVFPMFSDLGKEEGAGSAFGSMRIEPVYDKHAWAPLASVPLCLLLVFLPSLDSIFFFPRQASDYHWTFSRLYAAGIVHWVKTFLTCKWQSLPRTGKTLRHHIEQTVPQLLAQMKQNTTELCSFRFEHRIKTHSPVNQVVVDMHRQGMFSISGLSHLLAGYLEGHGIRLRALPVVEVLHNMETLLDAAEKLNIFSSIPRSCARPPLPHLGGLGRDHQRDGPLASEMGVAAGAR